MLGLALAATAARAEPDGAWHLGGVDSGAAWAYAEPPKAPSLILIGLRMKEPRTADEGIPSYNGATFVEELDCANSKMHSIKKIYYGADYSVVKSVEEPTNWTALHAGRIYDVLIAKCAGKPLPDLGQQTKGTDSDAQKWLAGLMTTAK